MLLKLGKVLHGMQNKKKDERGFTLIELLVVVIIIGILAAIAIPVFLNQRERAQVATVKSDVRNAVTMDTAGQTDSGTGIPTGTYASGAQIGTAPNTFRVSEGVSVQVTAEDIIGTYTNGPTGSWTYEKDTGRYVPAGEF